MISKADRDAIAKRHPNIPQDGFPEVEAALSTPAESVPAGIDDLASGQCSASISLAGEHFRCSLGRRHVGWPHRNAAAQAVWDGGSD